ncbi:MAG: response regulator [Ahrensia sp.]|nr:response regulator [Ahrensia sp.]
MAKILLTEDDDAVRAFVGRALTMDGHEIIEAGDGEEGFDCLQEHDGDFDLLLSDIKMPFMDGIELAYTAKAAWPELKILMMTGYAEQRERADPLSRIVIDVVSKPFTLAQIRQRVRDALGTEPLRDAC